MIKYLTAAIKKIRQAIAQTLLDNDVLTHAELAADENRPESELLLHRKEIVRKSLSEREEGLDEYKDYFSALRGDACAELLKIYKNGNAHQKRNYVNAHYANELVDKAIARFVRRASWDAITQSYDGYDMYTGVGQELTALLRREQRKERLHYKTEEIKRILDENSASPQASSHGDLLFIELKAALDSVHGAPFEGAAQIDNTREAEFALYCAARNCASQHLDEDFDKEFIKNISAKIRPFIDEELERIQSLDPRQTRFAEQYASDGPYKAGAKHTAPSRR